MTLLFAAVFTWLSLARHAAYQSHAFDLGNMDQAVWSTLHGDLLRFTAMSAGQTVLTSRLAIHVEPLLAVFAIFYVVHGGPETLLVIQAVIVALGAIPAYLLARAAFEGPWLALVFPAAYLLHPSLQSAVLDDFHTVTLSACFLLWAVYFVFIDYMPGFAVAALLAASTKEEVALLVAMLGLTLLVRQRLYAGFMAIICGVGWFLISVLLIIPSYNPAGQSPYLTRYSYLGHGLGGILLGILRHPGTVLHLLTSNTRLTYLIRLLHPLGFTSLLGLPVLLLALPAFAINMLSSEPTMYSGFYQYSAEIVPFLLAAAMIGIAAVGRFGREWGARGGAYIPTLLCVFLLLAAVVDTRQRGFSPLAAGYLVPSSGPHQRLADRALSGLPGGAPIAAADEIVPHVSDRTWVYLLPATHPRNGPAASYIVLDASIPSLPVRPATLHDLALRALRDGYGIVQAQDGILILRRGAVRTTLPPTFYSFLFRPGTRVSRERVHWGPLSLVGITVHPRSGQINPSRPAIALETYWRTAKRLAPRTQIVFYVSPVYSDRPPRFSSRWMAERDSPTWDWLPLPGWPAGRTIRADSLPLLPDVYAYGKVDVAIGVLGQGPAQGTGAGQRVAGGGWLARVATVQVGY